MESMLGSDSLPSRLPTEASRGVADQAGSEANAGTWPELSRMSRFPDLAGTAGLLACSG